MRRFSAVVVAASVGLAGSLPASAQLGSDCRSATPLRPDSDAAVRLPPGPSERWWAFDIASTSTVRVVLGDLPSDLDLDLRRRCSGPVIVSSGSPGRAHEEVLRELVPGSYRVRVSRERGRAAVTGASITVTVADQPISVLSATTMLSEDAIEVRGEIVNTTEEPRRNAGVAVTVLGEDDVVVGRFTWTTDLETVRPGERAAFHAQALVAEGAVAADVQGSSGTTAPPTPRLKVILGRDGRSGRVVNDTGAAVRFPLVTATVYDAAGEVAEVTYAFVGGRTLRPGGSVPFRFPELPLGGDIRVVAEGYRW